MVASPELIGGDGMPSRPSVISAPDPFLIGEVERSDTMNNNTGNRDTNGKTVRSKTINTGIRNLVLITAGQSNMMNLQPSSTTIINGSVLDNFNVYNGQMYAAADPLLGTTTAAQGGIFGLGCVASRIGDLLITNGAFDRVILVPISVGGTVALAWASEFYLKNRIICAMNRLAAAGITPAVTGVQFATIWGLGESDNVNGTTQSSYAASLNSWIATTRAAGMSGPIYINLETWFAGASSTIRAAQASCVTPAGGVYYGGDMDTLDATKRLSDNVHLNDTGAAAFATLAYNAMQASGALF